MNMTTIINGESNSHQHAASSGFRVDIARRADRAGFFGMVLASR